LTSLSTQRSKGYCIHNRVQDKGGRCPRVSKTKVFPLSDEEATPLLRSD